MDEIEIKIRRDLRDDFVHYAKMCLKIRSKSGEIKPFLLNQAQRHIHATVEQQLRATGRVRAIILKGRQQGCSTYTEGRFYWRATHRFGVRAFILTHDNDATNNLFEMAQRFHEHCPLSVRRTIDASNAKELIFAGIDSGYKLGTAGNKSVGRSSTIQLLHGSEVAYWPNASEHAKGILQAVPNESGTEIFIESTAQGIGNYFHEQWQLAESGQSDFVAIFIPWYWQDEYRRPIDKDFRITEEEMMLVDYYGLNYEQLSWRRGKINELSAGGLDGVKSFMQEYPCTPLEAFIMSGEDSFITPDIVERARKTKVDKIGPKIIACDPATTGNDRAAIMRRQTRCHYGLEVYVKKSATELANILHLIIINENPEWLIIDGSPAGGGSEIRDRLWQMGHKNVVISVLSSDVPIDQNKYFNKRAEMWARGKEALLDYPCEIPDSDELAADLCGPRLRMDDIHGRIKLEKKEDMRKRGIRSPDCGDTFALLYALPETAILKTANKAYEAMAKDMRGTFNNIDRLKKKAYG